jgi:hypothetical protein
MYFSWHNVAYLFVTDKIFPFNFNTGKTRSHFKFGVKKNSLQGINSTMPMIFLYQTLWIICQNKCQSVTMCEKGSSNLWHMPEYKEKYTELPVFRLFTYFVPTTNLTKWELTVFKILCESADYTELLRQCKLHEHTLQTVQNLKDC